MFKPGDLVVPTDEARKSFVFNKNVIFPWKVMEVRWGISLVLERYSRKAKPRRESWDASWFKHYEEKQGENEERGKP